MLPNCVQCPSEPPPSSDLVTFAHAVADRINSTIASFSPDEEGGPPVPPNDGSLEMWVIDQAMEPENPSFEKWSDQSWDLYGVMASYLPLHPDIKTVLCAINLPGHLSNILWPRGGRASGADGSVYETYAARVIELRTTGMSLDTALKQLDVELHQVQKNTCTRHQRVARGVATFGEFARAREPSWLD